MELYLEVVFYRKVADDGRARPENEPSTKLLTRSTLRGVLPTVGGTMTADCQACLVGVPQIGTPAGKPDNPIGACLNCGSLTCGEHGHRDPKPAFLCIECDVSLQAGCAGWIAWQRLQSGQAAQPSGGGSSSGGSGAGGTSPSAARAAAALQELLPAGFGGLVTSFEEWAERRPEYRLLISLMHQDLQNIVRRLDQASRRDVGAAGQTLATGRPGEISPGDFSALWRQLDPNGRQLLAAALVLALVMNLPAWSLPPQLRSIAQIAGISFRQDFPAPGKKIPFDESRYR
jgi:hypothetical protein